MNDSERYLTSKRTVDDRALHRQVLEIVRDRIARVGRPLQVLELGGGVGTMVDRLLDWQVLGSGDYTILDEDAQSLASARARAPRWHARAGLRVHTETAELEQWLRQSTSSFDLIIANAVLDLVDLETVLPLIIDRLDVQGTFWSSINFDGESVFIPEHPADGPVLDAYHASMGKHRSVGHSAGDSFTGRRLFVHLPKAGARILCAGSSDWVVFPIDQQQYPADEAFFLHHIVHTIDCELSTNSDLADVLPGWVADRHAQIDGCELVYVAHQLDFVATAVPR